MNTPPIRIGQLTDIHVADFADLRVRDFAGKRVSGWVNYTRKRAKEYDRNVLSAAVGRMLDDAPDVVVVTGDLSNLGLASELRTALTVLQPLQDAGIRTVVIPGNHDCYTRAASAGQFERMCVDFQVADASPSDAVYPFVVRSGDVSIVCFNSGIPTPVFMAYGRVGAAQLDRASKLIDAERAQGQAIVFAVHHHPTRAPHHKSERGRGMRNVAAFRALAKTAEASLIFHGHNHFFHQRRLREAEDVCVVGVSSATTNRRAPDTRVGQVGMYEVTADGLQRAGVASWDGTQFGPWVWSAPSDIPIESPYEALA